MFLKILRCVIKRRYNKIQEKKNTDDKHHPVLFIDVFNREEKYNNN